MTEGSCYRSGHLHDEIVRESASSRRLDVWLPQDKKALVFDDRIEKQI